MTARPALTAPVLTAAEPRATRRLNLTLWQAALFAATVLVGLAALSAAGLAIGLAVAGAGVLAVMVLTVWVIGANLARMGRRR